MLFDALSGFQALVNQVPELVQPLLVALIGAIPFIDEAAAGLGVVAGLHPLTAFAANVVGSTLAVVLVVLLGARVREAIVVRRARRAAHVRAPEMEGKTLVSATSVEPQQHGIEKKESKGEVRLARWLTRFGVPGASLLAPLALPFALTALFFASAGVSKGWVILWQVVAIVLWAAVVTVSATAAINTFGI